MIRNNEYMLMNKNTPLAKLNISGNTIYIDNILNELPTYISNIDNWLKYRLNPSSRGNTKILMKLAGINSIPDFLEISRAVSITDTFWVNTTKFETTWDEVNPYTTRITKASSDISLNGYTDIDNVNLDSPSPQYALDGSVPKCVKRDKDKNIYIYKTDGEMIGDKIGVRPYSEYYASLVASQLGYKWYTQYKTELHNGIHNRPQPYCKCPIFTNEDTGLLQYSESRFNEMSIQDFDEYLSKSSSSRAKLMRRHLREMLLLDAITVNPDRHIGNFGFLVDNNTFKIKDLSPIYDNDCSLAALYSIQDLSFDEAYSMVCSQRMPKTETGDYNDTARLAMTKELYTMLKQAKHISLGQAVPGISQNRVDFMEYLVNRRIKEIIGLFD